MTEFTIPIGFHKGNIAYDIAHANKTPGQVVQELFQNALDPDVAASHFHVIVTEKAGGNSRIDAYDDGHGVSREDMAKVWEKVGMSLKRGVKDAVGEKGIAKLSGLSISKQWIMITRPTRIKGSQYFSLTLNKDELRENEEPIVHGKTQPQGFGFGSVVSFKPTTRTSLLGITTSVISELSDLEFLAGELGSSFAKKLRETKADVQIIFRPLNGSERKITVRPREFAGRKEDPVTIKTSYGDVTFEIYSSSKPDKKARIIVLHDGRWEFDLSNITSLWKKVSETLGSGHYQGYINVSFCNLLPNREGFAHDEKEDVFVETVLDFCRAYIAPNLEDLKDRTRFALITRVFEIAVEKLDALLASDPQLLANAKLSGLVSSENVKSPSVEKTPMRFKKHDHPTLLESKIRRSKTSTTKSSSSKTPHERKPRSSFQDDSVKPRALVTSKMGLTLKYEEGNPKFGFAWRVRSENGVIIFNITHPDWIRINALKGIEIEPALKRYVSLLTVREISAQSITHVKERTIFEEHFDRKFFPIFFKAFM